MILLILEVLPVIVVAMLLGVWVVDIAKMFKGPK
jgi:hypothetical protein